MNMNAVWHQLDPVWQGTPANIHESPSGARGSDDWRTLLAGQGSPTVHVRKVTGKRLTVDVVEMRALCETDDRPPLVSELRIPVLQRQVYGLDGNGQRLFYAASWWSEETASQYLHHPDRPIWENLAAIESQLERRIENLTLGNCQSLEAEFGQKGPFWGRLYGFWHRGKLITVVSEVFSPLLWNYPTSI